MQEVKIRTSANSKLWPELWRTEWHSTSMKMAETSSSGPKRARASGGPLELVSAIFGLLSIRPKLSKSIIWPNFFRPFQIRPKEAPPYICRVSRIFLHIQNENYG